MSPKKKRSSRARCAARVNRKAHASPTYVQVKTQEGMEVAAGNRIAERRLKAQRLAAYGQGIKAAAKRKSRLALKARHKALRAAKKAVRKLTREAA